MIITPAVRELSRGLAVEALFTEPRAVILPADHPLAGKETVSVADLAAEHLLQPPDDAPEWRDIALELRERRPRRATPRLRTVEEKQSRRSSTPQHLFTAGAMSSDPTAGMY